MLTVALVLYAIYQLLKDFFNDDLPPVHVWTVAGVMVVAIISMASLPHGVCMGLTEPPGLVFAATDCRAATCHIFRTSGSI